MTEARHNLQCKSLYEQDILLWVEETVTKLKSRNFAELDLENLIEEVESLGISQRTALASRLMVLLEHLLKRLYVDSPYDYNGWERTIRTQRSHLDLLLDEVPSLKTYWDQSFAKAWKRARKQVGKDYPKTQFPEVWPFESGIEAMLDRDFWQEVS
jgi:hypothetical protein